jgi:hypothetical protein
VVGGLSVIGAILAIVGTAIIVCLAIYGGLTFLDKLEDAMHTRAYRKAVEKCLREIPEGDCFPAIPSECVDPLHRSGDIR